MPQLHRWYAISVPHVQNAVDVAIVKNRPHLLLVLATSCNRGAESGEPLPGRPCPFAQRYFTLQLKTELQARECGAGKIGHALLSTESNAEVNKAHDGGLLAPTLLRCTTRVVHLVSSSSSGPKATLARAGALIPL